MVAKIYSCRRGSWAINFALDTDAWRIAKEKNKQQLFLLYSSGTNVRYSVWGVPTRRSYCGIQQNCKLQNFTNLDLCRYVDTPLELYELLWEQYKSLAASRNCGITARPRWHKTQSANTNHGQWKSFIVPDDTISTPWSKKISRHYVITEKSVSQYISHCQVNAADTVEIKRNFYAMQNIAAIKIDTLS